MLPSCHPVTGPSDSFTTRMSELLASCPVVPLTPLPTGLHVLQCLANQKRNHAKMKQKAAEGGKEKLKRKRVQSGVEVGVAAVEASAVAPDSSFISPPPVAKKHHAAQL